MPFFLCAGFLISVLLFFALKDQSPATFREFRRKAHSYPDFLCYAALLQDGISLNKDASLSAAWSSQESNLDSANMHEMESLSKHMNAILKSLGNGWMIHTDIIRSFPSPSNPNEYTTELVLCVTYRLPGSPDAVLQYIREHIHVNGIPATGPIAHFHSIVTEIEDQFSTALGLKRLKTRTVTVIDEQNSSVIYDDLLSYFRHCVTCNSAPLLLPRIVMYLDVIIGKVKISRQLKPQVADQHVRMIGIHGFPDKGGDSYPDIFMRLDKLTISYRWSNRFIFVDQPTGQAIINGRRKNWAMGRQSIKNHLAAQASIALSASTNHEPMAFGHHTSVIVIHSPDPRVADQRASEVTQLLRKRGLHAHYEDVNAFEAFLGTHPANRFANWRKPLISTRNLTKFLPFSLYGTTVRKVMDEKEQEL